MKYGRFSSLEGDCKFYVSETGVFSDAWIRECLASGNGVTEVELLGHMDSGPSIHWEDHSVESFGKGRNGVMPQFYGCLFSETSCEQTFESWKRVWSMNGKVSLDDVPVETVSGELKVKKATKPKVEPSVD